MVWPILGYTDKIHSGMGMMFKLYPHLSFTADQMVSHLCKGFTWLTLHEQGQKELLKKLIQTGIKKLIQQGKVKKVTSNVSVESQWISIAKIEESGYINVTSSDNVAHNDIALKGCKGRALSARKLFKMNHLTVSNH